MSANRGRISFADSPKVHPAFPSGEKLDERRVAASFDQPYDSSGFWNVSSWNEAGSPGSVRLQRPVAIPADAEQRTSVTF
jgi:hypothetical protein